MVSLLDRSAEVISYYYYSSQDSNGRCTTSMLEWGQVSKSPLKQGMELSVVCFLIMMNECRDVYHNLQVVWLAKILKATDCL